MSIERLIQIICGYDHIYTVKKVSHDISLMMSFYRQLTNGVALTDRQGALAVTKLKTYAVEFNNVGIDVEKELLTPFYEHGIREIDREHKIFITEKNNKKYIAVKFPFNKKIQSTIRHIEKSLTGSSTIENKITLYTVNENNIYNLIKNLEYSFNIDNKLQNLYDRIVEIKNDTVAMECSLSREGSTIPASCLDALEHEIGPLSENNVELIIDRQLRFGYKIHNSLKDSLSNKSLSELTKTIANRPCDRVFIDKTKSKFSYKEFAETLTELHRWPCLIVFGNEGKDWATELENIVISINDFVKPEEIRVLTRLDNNINYGQNFNSYIKSHSLNGMVDRHTKCVIIDSNKMPKFLVKDNNWFPMSTIYVNVIMSSVKVQSFSDQCDLRILYGIKAPTNNFYEC